MTMTPALRDVMYSPSPEQIGASQLTAFQRCCEEASGRRFATFSDLHDFSVAELTTFWSLFLRWSGLLTDGAAERVCTDAGSCERGVFFPDLRLSYVENLLRDDPAEDPHRPVLIAHHAGRDPDRLTRGQLRSRVAELAAGLERLGVAAGDRVVAVARNNAEAVVAGLAAAAIGATFSGAAPEMGTATILSRFQQLEPTALLTTLTDDDDLASGSSDRVAEIAQGLPTLKAVISLDDGPFRGMFSVPTYRMTEVSTTAAPPLSYRRFPFNHPLFVLFSSGTTGPPKCIIHGAGGTLLEHVKEHRLHHDLRAGDRLFFQTSTAWMMWNWQLSALASGASIVVYDGPVTGPDTLWRIAAEEDATVFGTSPPYLQLCEELDYVPRLDVRLPHLRAVLSTGSVLQARQFDWVRENVGELPLQSISGGTDIIGCFVLGNPNLPVRRGALQCRSLGLDVQALGAATGPPGSAIGELICRNPFPSRPLGFVGDDDGSRFHDAYFSEHPDVWTHGDLLEIGLDGHVKMHGRSDGVLNVAGVRIGPAEIYEVLGGMPEIAEAMAVEQRTPSGPDPSRIVLLLLMAQPGTLDAALIGRIRRRLAREASSAHVPGLVVEVPRLPTTYSGKRSERAARDAVNGELPADATSLSNPRCLAEIRHAVSRAADAGAQADDAHVGGAGSTLDHVRSIWEDVFGVAPIEPDENFFDVGGTSLRAIRVLNAIHDRLGIHLPLSVFISSPTIQAMARVIDTRSEQEPSVIVPLKDGPSHRSLFIVHGRLGDVFELRPLVARLRADRSVYGFRAQGLDPRMPSHVRVEEMAAEYVRQMRALQPAGPYALAGYSFGGLVALEMARQLEAVGQTIECLVLIDSYVHDQCLGRAGRARFRILLGLRLVGAGLRAPRSMFAKLARRTLAAVAPFLGVRAAPDAVVLPPLLSAMERTNTTAYESYRPSVYRGPATLIRADRRELWLCEPLPVLRRSVGELTVERVPGGHVQMMTESGVQAVAAIIDACLAPSQPHGSGAFEAAAAGSGEVEIETG